MKNLSLLVLNVIISAYIRTETKPGQNHSCFTRLQQLHAPKSLQGLIHFPLMDTILEQQTFLHFCEGSKYLQGPIAELAFCLSFRVVGVFSCKTV